MLLSKWSQSPFSELEELPPSFVASLPSPRVSKENSS